MSVIADLTDIRPSLLLDFANSRRVDPRLQCTRASTATCYGPDGRLRTVPANVPRIDYDPKTGRCLGLLAEPASTNTALNSETFTNWSKGRSTVVDTTVPTPDPAKFAKKLVDTTENNEHVVNYAFTPAASTTYVFSCFLKAAERNFAFISIRNFANQNVGWSVSIDLTTYQTYGAPTSTAGETLTIIPLPDGWCRVSLSTTTIAAPAGTINPTIGVKDSLTASGAYVGDGVSGIYIFGGQVEIGATPSSYISTAAAQVTRALDSLVLPAAVCAEQFGSGFTLLQQLSTQAPIPAAGSLRHLGASIYANGNNRVRIYANSANGGRIAFSGRLNGATDTFAVSTTTGLASAIPPISAALAVSPSGFGRACVNGGTVVTSSPQTGSLSGIAPSIYIGTLSGDFNAAEQAMHGHLQRLAVYPVVMTDAQMQRLSAQ